MGARLIISNNQVKQVLESYGKTHGKGRRSKVRRPAGDKPSAPIQAARQVIGSVPEVREDRIKELKESIRTGHYDRSGEDIAKKMISRSLVDSLLGQAEEED